MLVLTTRGGSRRAGHVWIRKVAAPLPVRVTAADDPVLPLARVVSLARAVVDTALLHGRTRPVRALVTTAVQRELCSVEELTAQLRCAPSVAEAEAAELLRMGGVPTFELNVPIVHAGRVIAVADVLWRKLRAVLEIDSREYHLSEAQWKAMMARHNKLTNVGLCRDALPAVGDPGRGPGLGCRGR